MGSALDIPTEPLAGCQHLLARSARLGPQCASQREQNSRNEPHSGPISARRALLGLVPTVVAVLGYGRCS
jgi:hypothetical protein